MKKWELRKMKNKRGRKNIWILGDKNVPPIGCLMLDVWDCFACLRQAGNQAVL